jgi:HD-GYP domain-containing protein (c-di-GMP phosphodiesterase class II)
MRTDRSYRKALAHDVALAELRDNAGSQFDPQVVEALIELVDTPPASSLAPPRAARNGHLRRAAAPVQSAGATVSGAHAD